MKQWFSKAIQIYPRALENEMNISLYFVWDFPRMEGLRFFLTGNSDYQVFLNGSLLAYGPARAAIHEYRVDELALGNLQNDNRLVVELSGYQCFSFTRPKSAPFFIGEVRNEQGDVLACSGKDFRCYRNASRLQKVVRFSYQREFSESYDVSASLFESLRNAHHAIPLPQIDCDPVQEGRFLPRNVHYSRFDTEIPFAFAESGVFRQDPEMPVYQDRYMTSDFLGIFPKEQWAVDPNAFISQLVFVSSAREATLKEGHFLTYANAVSKTGFIRFSFSCLAKSRIAIAFDEIDTRKNGEDAIGINFHRNTTHNLLTYDVGVGDYDFVSFEPYTAKYLRIIVETGEIAVKSVGMIPFENPDKTKLTYRFSDNRLQKLFDAGVNTFAQNAVDILMDCPSRERAGWLCDSFFSGRSEMLITGANLVERNFLENYAHYQNQGDQPQGMIPMCYPCDFADRGYIPNWPMFYILEIEQYLKRHDDDRLLSEAEQQIFAFLSWCRRYENTDGLLEDPAGCVFVEWSHANDNESTRGVNFPTNALYAECLEACGRMFDRPDYLNHGKRIKQYIKEKAFDGAFYEDNAVRGEDGLLHLSGRVCETTQYYLYFFGVLSKEENPSLYERVMASLGPKRDPAKTLPDVFPSNMFIGDYLRLLVLLQNGDYPQVADESVDYFYQMAKKTGTLWEFDSTYASLTHCFASYIINILLEVLTGVRFLSPKTRQIVLSPFSPLPSAKDFSVNVPLDGGVLAIQKKSGKLAFRIPDGWTLLTEEREG